MVTKQILSKWKHCKLRNESYHWKPPPRACWVWWYFWFVCLFFSIQSLTQEWWKTAGWWLWNMKPSTVRKIQQEELEQRVSVAFPFLHLFWEDHLCGEGHLPDLSDQLARKRAALPLPSVAPQENRLRLFAYFMMPWANRLLISRDPGWILIGNTG